LWTIFQDSKSNYWFGSDGEGLFRYDGAHILHLTTADGLSSNSIRQIQEDQAGNLYFSTLGGIDQFDGKKITPLQPIKSNDWKLEPGDLWFHLLGKSGEKGPYRYDGDTLYNLQFPKHYLHDSVMANELHPFFSPYEVYTIYKDRQGGIWFGTSVFGACRFDGQSVKWMYEKDLTIHPISGGTFGIRSVFEDKEGLFWLCNTEQRFQFDFTKTSGSDRLQYQKTAGIGKPTDYKILDYIYFSYIIEDRKGDLWLTTWEKGVFRYDGSTLTNYRVQDAGREVNLISMYQDNQGKLWLGTPDNGVFTFNGDSFERFLPEMHQK
jgi:ligand-binding sensor domain-containing protein